jgi:hypothetical protein
MRAPGAVAERLGRGLQSLVQRFESARRLITRIAASRATSAVQAVKSQLNRPLHHGASTSVKLALHQREKEAEMHALVVRVTIHNADRTREVLNSQVVPQVSGAPGFKAGYWTWATGGGGTNGLSMIIFDSEESARAAGDRVSAIAADAPDDVTLDGVEVREVVASA